jgi:ATP-dependent DNA helicase PIF1
MTKYNFIGKIALAVASSGIAALLLHGGRTAHSRFKIPIDSIHDTSTCSISMQSGLAKLIQNAEFIVWDEISMASKLQLDCVDRTIRDITKIDSPFGGKVVVLAGDFRQVCV